MRTERKSPSVRKPTPEDPPKAETRSPTPSKATAVSSPKLRRLDSAVSKLPAEGFPNPPSGEYRSPDVTLSNISHLLDKYGVSARYNMIKKRAEFSADNLPILADSGDNAMLSYIKSLANLNGMRSSDVLRFAEAVCFAKPYNPIEDWILSKPWDGVDRLSQIYATLTTDADFPTELKEAIIMRWLLSAVAAAFMAEGFRARGLLTLQGRQGLGKTQWFAQLTKGFKDSDRYVLLGQHLDIANKDDVLTSIQHWIVELGELDSTFRKDIAGLKAFITKERDHVRKPYDKADSTFPRRTVFGGSVNSPYFLVDPTGNSRFWTLPVVAIDYEHDVDMQQLFAQLYAAFKTEEQWWLTPEEEALLAQQNAFHLATNPTQELVRGAIDPERIGDPDLPAYGARELLVHLSIKEPSNAQARDCGEVLRELIGKPKRIQGYDKWRVPLISDDGPFVRV
jgi:hypothetical protein